jgi:hypothetical protein
MNTSTKQRRPSRRMLVGAYLISLHCLIALVLWKSDFVPKAVRHLSFDVPRTIRHPRYEELLTFFPEEQPGIGVDSHFGAEADQPMTYGLVLSAESIRYARLPTGEGARRIRIACDWLLKNRDADSNDVPGWGLPHAWDAFGDGTVNQPNCPYTITTAYCLNGLLDALTLQDFWSESEKRSTRRLLCDVAIHWSKEFVSKSGDGKYFWYSPAPHDDLFCPDVSAMFAGSLVRIIEEHADHFSEEQLAFLDDVVYQCLTALIAKVKMRYGAPFWDYVATSQKRKNRKRNDVVHHAYILWGIETYREFGRHREIPWSRAQSVESMDRFWRHGRIWEFPQDINKRYRKSEIVGGGHAFSFLCQIRSLR